MVEITDNGIKYDWSVSGPQGARFELFVHDRQGPTQIEEAKRQLRRDQDVVKIYVTKVTREEWDSMKLFLHPVAAINDRLNKEYHEQLR